MFFPRLVVFASALLAGLLVLGVQRQPTVEAQDKGAPKQLTAPFTKAEAEKARAEWAKYLQVPERKMLDLGSGVKLEIVLLPPGTFQMGSPDGEKGRVKNETQHEVEISKAFYLAVTETTQAQYQAISGRPPSKFKGDTLPVEKVSWADARNFCSLVSRMGTPAQLPTEAQWEYACRAGTTSPFYFGAELNGKQANCAGTKPYGTATEGPYLEKTTEAGSRAYPPNAFGLADMHGNVSEWCWDAYRTDYENLPKKDPLHDHGGSRVVRVVRGGSWAFNPMACRAASRHVFVPDDRYYLGGFRVVVALP